MRRISASCRASSASCTPLPWSAENPIVVSSFCFRTKFFLTFLTRLLNLSQWIEWFFIVFHNLYTSSFENFFSRISSRFFAFYLFGTFDSENSAFSITQRCKLSTVFTSHSWRRKVFAFLHENDHQLIYVSSRQFWVAGELRLRDRTNREEIQQTRRVAGLQLSISQKIYSGAMV